MARWTYRTVAVVAALLALMLVGGCPTSSDDDTTSDGSTGSVSGDGTSPSTGTDGATTGDAGTATDDGGSSGTGDSGTSGAYDPAQSLELQNDTVQIDVPAGATEETVTLTVREATSTDLPVPLPGDAGLAGAVCGPGGQTFSKLVIVSVQLSTETVAPALPVVTYDTDKGCWVGTGVNATVADNGIDVTFPVRHFSTFGVPDPIPVPTAGDDIGSFVVISNNGTFSSNEISSTNAALTYSEFGDTFSISMTSQEIDQTGIVTQSMGLTAQAVTDAGSLVVGVFAGGRSIFNDGQFNEPAYGVMFLSVSGSSVTVTVYAATAERVICGTLTGQSL